MRSLVVSRLSREGGAFSWRRLSASAGLGSWCWRDVDGEWFLEGMPSSAGKRDAELLGGKHYWYKSKATVPKLGDGAPFWLALGGQEPSEFAWLGLKTRGCG